MSTTVTINGANYSIPRTGDDSWSNTGGVDDYLVALSTGVLQKAGGSFTLTAEVNFGGSFGLKSLYYKSTGTNPASAGVVRLANAESIKWRNAANGADLDLTVDSSNVLNFNGAPLVNLALGSASTALVMNVGGTAYSWAAIVNANISASAAIAYSKLALTSSIVNADVNASAAIAYSKLALTGSILNADLAGSIAYSKLSLTGAILNADLAGSIAYSKLSLTGAILNADLAGSIAYSKLTLTGAIVNADVSSSAAIAYSKLALTGAILNADLAGSIAYSKLTLTGSIVNADVSSSAAIAYSKLALTGAILNADLAGSIAYSKLALTGSILNADLAGSIAYSKLTLTGAVVNADISASAAIAYSKLNLAASIATADLASGLLVPITKGGTGQTTANAALNAFLPDQTGNGGKLLSTDGSNTSWASAASSTLNQYNTDIGNSSNVRTATNTNLLGDAVGKTVTATVTMTIATPGVVTWTSHGLSTYDKVYFTNSGGALPTGVTASTTYFVTVVDANSFKLSTTYNNAVAGTFVATSGSQSGTHTGFSGGLAIADASATARGLVTPTTQTFAGIKTNASMPAATASATTTFTYNSNAGFLDLTWRTTTEVFTVNQGSAFTVGATSASSPPTAGIFTVPAGAGGIYLVSACVKWSGANLVAGGRYLFRLYKNTSGTILDDCDVYCPATGKIVIANRTFVCSLAAGDIIWGRVLSDQNHSSSTVSISGDESFLSIAKLY
jgi:hypothetical protein